MLRVEDTLDAANNDAEQAVVERLRKKAKWAMRSIRSRRFLGCQCGMCASLLLKIQVLLRNTQSAE